MGAPADIRPKEGGTARPGRGHSSPAGRYGAPWSRREAQESQPRCALGSPPRRARSAEGGAPRPGPAALSPRPAAPRRLRGAPRGLREAQSRPRALVGCEGPARAGLLPEPTLGPSPEVGGAAGPLPAAAARGARHGAGKARPLGPHRAHLPQALLKNLPTSGACPSPSSSPYLDYFRPQAGCKP